ncbi:MAG: GDSL-type esterase/lipase family protein [Bacteroidota bacterium]
MQIRYFSLALLATIFFSFCSCEDEVIVPNPPSNSANIIMPLGASRVEGARPAFESYRYELWKLLVDGGWDFDYIGTRDDEANYPSYAEQSFDLDHEGRGGWTSGQILGGIEDWLVQAGTPDIVLFSSPGGNDALQNRSYEQAIANINGIIDALQAANPEITILIEQLAPAVESAMTGDLLTYFESLQADVVTIASEQTTDQSTVIVVDMATGFTDEFLADDVHYNEAGARFIADRYYTNLVQVLE